MSVYAVLKLEKEIKARAGTMEQLVNLTWRKGMIGVLPVFSTYKDAKKYAKEGEILELVEPGESDE